MKGAPSFLQVGTKSIDRWISSQTLTNLVGEPFDFTYWDNLTNVIVNKFPDYDYSECDEGDPSEFPPWGDYVRKEIHERLDLSDRKLVKLELLDRNENLYEFIHYDGGCDLVYEDGCFKFMFDGVLRSKNDADLFISFRTLIDHIEITISDNIDSNPCESPKKDAMGKYCQTRYPCTSWLDVCDELILSYNKLTYLTSDSLAIRNPKSN